MHIKIIGRLKDMSRDLYYIFEVGFCASDPGKKYKISGFHHDLGIFNSRKEIKLPAIYFNNDKKRKKERVKKRR